MIPRMNFHPYYHNQNYHITCKSEKSKQRVLEATKLEIGRRAHIAGSALVVSGRPTWRSAVEKPAALIYSYCKRATNGAKPGLQTRWPTATRTRWSMEADGETFVTGELAGTACMLITLKKKVLVSALEHAAEDIIVFLKGELSRNHIHYPYSLKFEVADSVAAPWFSKVGAAKGAGRSRTGEEANGEAAAASSSKGGKGNARSRGGGAKGGRRS